MTIRPTSGFNNSDEQFKKIKESIEQQKLNPQEAYNQDDIRSLSAVPLSPKQALKQEIMREYPSLVNVKITEENFHPNDKEEPFGRELLVNTKIGLSYPSVVLLSNMELRRDPKNQHRILGFMKRSYARDILNIPMDENITTPRGLSTLQKELKIPFFVLLVDDENDKSAEDIMMHINAERPMMSMLKPGTPVDIRLYAEDIDLGMSKDKEGKKILVANLHDYDREEDINRLNHVCKNLKDELKQFGPIKICDAISDLKFNFYRSDAFMHRIQEVDFESGEFSNKPVYRGRSIFHPASAEKFLKLADQSKMVGLADNVALSIFEPFLDFDKNVDIGYILYNLNRRSGDIADYVNTIEEAKARSL